MVTPTKRHDYLLRNLWVYICDGDFAVMDHTWISLKEALYNFPQQSLKIHDIYALVYERIIIIFCLYTVHGM